jgi:hypothetical protein
MRWDFEDDNIPLPGGEMTGYLWIRPRAPGARVEVHQLADTPAQAEFLEAAWALVLGRLRAGVAGAVRPGPAAGRAPRPKRRPPGPESR